MSGGVVGCTREWVDGLHFPLNDIGYRMSVLYLKQIGKLKVFDGQLKANNLTFVRYANHVWNHDYALKRNAGTKLFGDYGYEVIR